MLDGEGVGACPWADHEAGWVEGVNCDGCVVVVPCPEGAFLTVVAGVAVWAVDELVFGIIVKVGAVGAVDVSV